MEKKELAQHLADYGCDCIKDGLYPRLYLWDYIKIEHPELIEEFKNWFDAEVRV